MYSDTDSRIKMMVTKSALPRKKSMAALFRKLTKSSVICFCLCWYSGSWSSGFKYFYPQEPKRRTSLIPSNVFKIKAKFKVIRTRMSIIYAYMHNISTVMPNANVIAEIVSDILQVKK